MVAVLSVVTFIELPLIYQLHGPLPKSFVETIKRRTEKATTPFLTLELESCPTAYLHL